jgi:S-adenosylmethionine decarboxylase
MDEYHEIISHIPLQYFEKLDDIKVVIFESNDNIYRELQKYNIKNITKYNDIRLINTLVEKNYDIIILENNYSLNITILNNLINKTKILIHAEKTNNQYFIWNYLDWFKISTNYNEKINSKYINKIKINDYVFNYYSNHIDPINYFLNFKNFNNLNIKTKYYNTFNHIKYFIDTEKSTKENLIMGAHIMLDFAQVNFDLLENIDYIKNLMNDIAVEEKFIVLNTVCHKFEPQGFTMIFLLSTSHFSIHTYPEHNKCSIDLYSCDMNVDYNNVINKLSKGLKSDNFKLHQVIRKI